MQLTVLQHVAFEGPAAIADWASPRGHELSVVRLDRRQRLPGPDDVAGLVLMGGPMSVYEERKHPWLTAEKRLARQVARAGRPVLGICLGAQVLAAALGGRVFPAEQKEIGWFPVEKSDAAADDPLFAPLPKRFDAFHWHGDTFVPPPDAVHLARSEACAQQAFRWGERAVGLQFHLEATAASIDALLTHAGDDLTEGSFVQSPDEIRGDDGRVAAANALAFTLLDRLFAE